MHDKPIKNLILSILAKHDALLQDDSWAKDVNFSILS
jgi:hypothetical protein